MRHQLLLLSMIGILLISCNEELDVEIVNPHIEKLIAYSLPTTERYAQGMDIIDGCFFQAYSDGTIDVISLETKAKLQTIESLLDENGKVLHMNDISFRDEDGQHTLVIPGNDINSIISIFDVEQDEQGLYCLQKIKEIQPPLLDSKKYIGSTQYFGDGDDIVQVAYKRTETDWYGDIIVEGYTFNTINEDIIYSKQWTIEHEQLWAMQGSVIVNNNCYMIVGVPQGDARIYRIDMKNGSLSCYIDLRLGNNLTKNEEMQGIAFYNNFFYISTTYGLYKLQ